MRQQLATALSALMGGALVCLAAPPIGAQQSTSYRLNPGDVLQVSVWKEEDLKRELVVLPDGTLSFPLAGHVTAAGLTPEELQKTLAQKIEHYIPDAAELISVSVQQANGNKVFVTGLVNKPGEFQAAQPMTVLQALSLAGGLTQFASEENINIIRREDGKETAIPFNYSAVKQGRDLDSNIELKSGDVVVVPGKSLF